MPDGSWAPLATGELLLGYADEAGELPVAPVPHLLAQQRHLHGLSQAASERRHFPGISRSLGYSIRGGG